MKYRHNFLTLFLLGNLFLLGCSQKKETIAITDAYFEKVAPEFKGDIAFETTAFVEQFWRVAGNTGFNKTVYKIVEQLETVGFVEEVTAPKGAILTYRIEKRPMKRPTWEPVDARLRILGEEIPLLEYKTNRNMIYQYASSTQIDGITAEVIYLEKIEDLEVLDVKGKIIYTNMSPYRVYKKTIVEGGALGLITYNNPDYLQPEKNVTSIQFRGIPYNEDISAWGIALSYQAKERLEKKLSQGKVTVNAFVKTKIYPSEELTVVATVKGSELPKESLVFSAHIQEPGANDNATGVGTQLEMASITANLIKSKKLDLKRTLTFLWGDEIISTRRYIEEKEKRTSAINWGISLDMVGENTAITGGTFLIEKMPDPSAIWTRGNDKHSEWGGRKMKLEEMKPHYLNDFIITVFKEQGKRSNWEVQTNPFEGGSDHTPFLDADLPGILLWHFTDQFYHTDNDRIDKVSQETMKNVGIAALVSAYTLLNSDTTTASWILEEIMQVAKSRLTTEFELSKDAIVDGASKKSQIEILNAWSDWYVKTIATVKDMTTDPDIDEEIMISQNKIRAFSENLLSQL
ncbi:M28 family peptidase [uncultured Dokdonia sp.]|uniref:M28 family peptidase n=1 Tax=uncultured Dokdonia sp. TaxID=575653 RepID=UPI0026153A88|nr:M28 family peptidase [uncultured Dokdonia sp.]